jgi:hypothetical protein
MKYFLDNKHRAWVVCLDDAGIARAKATANVDLATASDREILSLFDASDPMPLLLAACAPGTVGVTDADFTEAVSSSLARFDATAMLKDALVSFLSPPMQACVAAELWSDYPTQRMHAAAGDFEAIGSEGQ